MRATSVGMFHQFVAMLVICYSKKPNILFLNVDQMDGRNMDPTSTDQYYPIQMPNLRHLAMKGTQFIRHYSNSPECVPARTVMWSGRRISNINVFNGAIGFTAMTNGTLDSVCTEYYNESACRQRSMLQNLNYTILDGMQSLGYDVYIYGKLHIGAGIMQLESQSNATNEAFEPPFSKYSFQAFTRSANIAKPMYGAPMTIINDSYPDPHKKDVNVINKCIERINNLGNNNNSTSAPFLLYCSIDMPHPPYNTNNTWLQGVNISNISIPTWKDKSMYHPFDEFSSKVMNVWNQSLNDSEIRKYKATYYGLNVESDYLMGKLVDTLYKNGFNESNSYIVFTSDHGDDNLDHRQQEKWSMYESGVRIPLFIIGPTIKSNHIVTNLTESVDILPTLIEIGSNGNGNTSQIPSWLDGTSLMQFMSSDVNYSTDIINYRKHPDYILSQFHSIYCNTGSFMVRKDHWKYIQYGHYLSMYKYYKPQLFDLINDPNECNDVSHKYPQIVNEMENTLMGEYNYEYVDCIAKHNNFNIFNEFVWNVYNQSMIYSMFQSFYAGFNETDWNKILDWRNQMEHAPPCNQVAI